MSLGEALPAEINRVREIQNQFRQFLGTPGVMVAPQIALMEIDIQEAIRVSIEGDVIGMIRAYKELQGWTG